MVVPESPGLWESYGDENKQQESRRETGFHRDVTHHRDEGAVLQVLPEETPG